MGKAKRKPESLNVDVVEINRARNGYTAYVSQGHVRGMFAFQSLQALSKWIQENMMR